MTEKSLRHGYDGGMDIATPHTAVAPKVDGRALMVLVGPTRPLSGREVARLAGASQNATNLVLRRLVAHGLVHVQEAGRARPCSKRSIAITSLLKPCSSWLPYGPDSSLV